MISKILNLLRPNRQTQYTQKEAEYQEAMIYNYLGGMKVQCPQCSHLCEIETIPKCDTCKAKFKLLTQTITPGYAVDPSSSEGKD